MLAAAEVAPADVHLVAAGKGEQLEAAVRLADELELADREVCNPPTRAHIGVQPMACVACLDVDNAGTRRP